eukprot:1157652-Pelagomonas_calceolata.AAC.6
MLAKRPGCTALSHVSMQCPFDLMVTQGRPPCRVQLLTTSWCMAHSDARNEVVGQQQVGLHAGPLQPHDNTGSEHDRRK